MRLCLLHSIPWVFVGALMLAAPAAHALNASQVYKQAGPAVVLILGSDDGKSGSGGTGSVITPEGKVITNAHVVIGASGQPYRTLFVFLKPPKVTGDNRRDLSNRYKASVLKWSPADELDLALLQIENAPPNLPTIAFANPDDVGIGDDAVAIGHPEQGGLWTLTTGAVSTVIANFAGIDGKDVFQTECSVNRGNSGGPLLDASANMIGINTSIARKGAGGVTITDVNFALKSSVAVIWLSGAGMGLAYAAPNSGQQMVVAVAPTRVAPSDPKPPARVSSQPVREPPPATIVVAEKPPAQPEKLRTEGQTIGTHKAPEKLEKGKRVDPKTAKAPTYVTEKRPMSLDDIRRQQMKEMEDMLDEMSGRKGKKGGRGLGLW